jgi:hypothetical protein
MYVDQVATVDDRLLVGRNSTYGLCALANNLLAAAIGCMSIAGKAGLGMNPSPIDTLQATPILQTALIDPVLGYRSDPTR